MLSTKQKFNFPPRYKKATYLNIEQIKKQNSAQKQAFIDDEYLNVIEKVNKRKIGKLIKGKELKKRKKMEDTFGENIRTIQDEKLFQRSFFREKVKSAEKTQNVEQTRRKIFTKLGYYRKEPEPFFPINRKNLIIFEKSQSKSLQIDRLTKTSRFFQIQGERIHPYSHISERMSREVSEKRRATTEFVNFSPFNDIQPID